MIPQELINKYFRNECNEEERIQVLQYFEENPGEWDKYMNEEDWERFETNERLHPALSRKLFDTVSQNTFARRSPARRTWVAVAASVVLLAGLAWVLMMQQSGSKQEVESYEVPQIAGVTLLEKVNTTNQPMTITMDDGSTATLSPNSSIQFYSQFDVDNKRRIYLKGRALFNVAKDPKKPFTVFADEVATTVLGTQFTVSSFRDSNEIRVALHEGKVMVNASDSIYKKWKSNMYLVPGDELVYNKQTMLASIRHAISTEPLVKAGASFKKSGTIQKPDWYEFNGLPLSQVLDQLSAYYQVDIYYYPADIRNKFFSAKMKNTDSLETILSDIALLNRLSINKKDGSFIIKKNQ